VHGVSEGRSVGPASLETKAVRNQTFRKGEMNRRGRKAWWNRAWPASWLGKTKTALGELRTAFSKEEPGTEAAQDAVERRDPGAVQPPPVGFALNLSAEGVARVLLVIAAALVATSLAAGLVGLLGGPFVRLLYVGADLSIPSWYSALMLALASALLAAIACAIKSSQSPRYFRRWLLLSAIFAYLSCDEMLRLHERMTETALLPALDALGFAPGGIFYYPWVIVYAPLVVIFALAYFSFWRALPTKTRTLFLAAGVIFVGGALGVEVFNAYHDEAPGRELVVVVGTHLEESLEMGGVIVFIYALATYIRSSLGLEELRLRLTR
jgi:hypothetical protein